MQEPDPSTHRKRGILSEELVHRPDQPELENPYWQAEVEAQEHPDPSLGCIRRGLCCKSSPGWFAPGEVERAAAFLDLEPDALVRRYLVIDSIEVDGRRAEAFVPVKLGRDGEPMLPPASRADRLYRTLRGPCVFYDGTGCRIYGARPYECQRYVCTNQEHENPSHEQIGRMWLAGHGPEEDAGHSEAEPAPRGRRLPGAEA
jgi:Fe-S-cluster containining protein